MLYIHRGRDAGCEMGEQSGGPDAASAVAALGLKEGDDIEIHVADARTFGVAPPAFTDSWLRNDYLLFILCWTGSLNYADRALNPVSKRHNYGA